MVVRGEGGRTVEAQKLAPDLLGVIGQFTAGARQNLAPLDVAGQRKEIPEGTLQFFKNNGQEQLVVTLSTPVPVVEDRPTTPLVVEYADFCVVDAVLRNASDVEVRIAAIGVQPERFQGAPFEGEIEFDYPEEQPTYSAEKEPGRALIQYSRHAPREGSLSIPSRVSSLLFDLREVAPGERVSVDLWGAYFPDENEGIDTGEPGDSATGPALRQIATATLDYFADTSFDEDNLTGWSESVGRVGAMPFTDPLGNYARFDGPVFDALFADAMALDEWDETVLVTEPTSDPDASGPQYFSELIEATGQLVPPGPPLGEAPSLFVLSDYSFENGGGYYTQRRFDPETGAVSAFRRVIRAAIGWALRVEGNVHRIEARVNFWEQVVPLSTLGPGEDPADRTLDLVSQFYRKVELEAYDTPHQDGAGIWALEPQIPERRMFANAPIAQEDLMDGQQISPASGNLLRLGRIIVDRVGESVTFEPA